MNGRAESLPALAARCGDEDRDPGELFEGDHDPSEVTMRPLRVWHPSFLDAELAPPEPFIATQTGKQYLQSLIDLTHPAPGFKPTRKPQFLTCWHDTPELYRRLLARAAGLQTDVVYKLDRDLTEAEKAMLRATASELRDCAAALVSL